MDVSENIVSIYQQSVDERALIRSDYSPQRKGKKIQLSENQKQESKSNKLILDATETLCIKQKHIRKRNKIYENKKIRKPWSAQEDHQLQCSLQLHGPNWVQIAASMINRNPSQCAQRWKRIKPDDLKKRKPFTKEEDQLILKLVAKYRKNWSRIAKFLPEKTSKQIRERFINKLNPQIKFEPFTEEEDHIILKAYQEIGSKWTKIQDLLVGRPENMIKNRFYSYLRQKYLKIKNPYYAIPSKKAIINKDQQSKIDKAQHITEEKHLTESRQYMEHYNDIQEIQPQLPINPYFSIPYPMMLGNFSYPQYQLYQAPVAVVYSPIQQGQLNQQHGLNTLFQQQVYLGHQVTNQLVFLSNS
ncbi:unnamed protein product (macronuclear) [Paramecium tetraurelia]|uniref:Myb-like DNA-binding domain containing protein n=1 Tax=Paramecium tetraurelia TaxID=5888 RepID=A0ECB4_PARTE|nr:uncharacterized protein GSPATT00025668001 [Paramecium tetraurelia]CAK92931.1 unnamed protein product [Paramecium tetraurelia]|eukprot:XP_001460328.1 hypothetical protein (macronuclear) [Paramecium tetraurelia strain d4-2]